MAAEMLLRKLPEVSLGLPTIVVGARARNCARAPLKLGCRRASAAAASRARAPPGGAACPEGERPPARATARAGAASRAPPRPAGFAPRPPCQAT
jgi:hypothetical protein